MYFFAMWCFDSTVLHDNSDAVDAEAVTVLIFAGSPIACNLELTHTNIHNNVSLTGVWFATTNVTNPRTTTERFSTIIRSWSGTPKGGPTSGRKATETESGFRAALSVACLSPFLSFVLLL